MGITELELQTLSTTHVEALCRLYNLVFNKKVEKEYFINKYGLDDPSHPQIATIAVINGEAIGLYGCYLSEVKSADRLDTFSIGNVCDFILLKEHRGTGLFDKLYQHTLTLAKKANAECLIGFQSDQTYKVCKRNGWLDQTHFNRYHLVFNQGLVPMVKRKLMGTSALNDFVAKKILPFKEGFDFNEVNRVEKKLTQWYDDLFFQSKKHCEHYQVIIEGCHLWLKADRTLTCGFAAIPSTKAAEKCLYQLRLCFGKGMISEMILHVQSDSNEDKILSSLLTRQDSFKISYLPINKNFGLAKDIKLNFMDMDIF